MKCCNILRSLDKVFVFEFMKCLCIGAPSKDPARFFDLGFWIFEKQEAQEYKRVPKKQTTTPKSAPEEPSKLRFASPSPCNALPREVHMDLGRTQMDDGDSTESATDAHDQPKIYTIWDHTLEVLMHPSVLDLHAVRVVHTPHGAKWYLHLKVRVRCGKKEMMADVMVDTGAQVSLVRKGLFSDELLKRSRRPVHLKVANGEIMGVGTHEATTGMDLWEPT